MLGSITGRRRRIRFGLCFASVFRFAGRLGRLRGNTGQPFLFGAFFVEGEEAGEDFVAEVVGPAVAPGFFAGASAASGFFVLVVIFVVEQEFAGGGLGEVVPAVGFED